MSSEAEAHGDERDRISRPHESGATDRSQISMVCRPQLRAQILADAKKNGRTLSKELEFIVERAYQYDAMFERLGQTRQELEQQSVHGVLSRHGFKAVRKLYPSGSYLYMVPHNYDGQLPRPSEFELEAEPTQAAPPELEPSKPMTPEERIARLEKQIEEMARVMAQAGIGQKRP